MGEIDKAKIGDILEKLFSDAAKTGGEEYIYTLLRVTGIEHYEKEPLLQLHDSLKHISTDDPPLINVPTTFIERFSTSGPLPKNCSSQKCTMARVIPQERGPNTGQNVLTIAYF